MNYEEFAARFAALPVEANIYRVVDDENSLPDAQRLAARCGFDADASWNEVGPVLEFVNGDESFAVFRPSGAVQYVDSARWQQDDGSSLVVTDDEAIAAADRQLERLELAADTEFRATKVTRLHVADARKGEQPQQVRIVDVGVVYSRIIDGIVVEGQGGSIVVYLDSKLEPTGFERTSRKLELVDRVTGWRGPGGVIAEVEQKWGAVLGESLFVDDVRICYVELSRLESQTYVQPAYALTLRLPRHDLGEDRTAEDYVVAAINSPGPLVPITEVAEFGPRAGGS